MSIRPKGVVSKNAIGERKIRVNIVPCKTEAAFKVPTEITTVATMMKQAYQSYREKNNQLRSNQLD